MPPILLGVLSVPVVWAYHSLLSSGMAAALSAGGYMGYVMYDLIHYYLHHGIPATGYARGMKSWHLDHHYKDWDKGFGITSKGWDWVFGTL
jgi:4-hydroxysphinganine ceramide fatty acyl 2-hydroxylase